tara:strand:- start:79 stop:324 length:246 start_codon:yes stop_codon:yes gene_type:complete
VTVYPAAPGPMAWINNSPKIVFRQPGAAIANRRCSVRHLARSRTTPIDVNGAIFTHRESTAFHTLLIFHNVVPFPSQPDFS